jgi:hypothetical protein
MAEDKVIKKQLREFLEALISQTDCTLDDKLYIAKEVYNRNLDIEEEGFFSNLIFNKLLSKNLTGEQLLQIVESLYFCVRQGMSIGPNIIAFFKYTIQYTNLSVCDKLRIAVVFSKITPYDSEDRLWAIAFLIKKFLTLRVIPEQDISYNIIRSILPYFHKLPPIVESIPDSLLPEEPSELEEE